MTHGIFRKTCDARSLWSSIATFAPKFALSLVVLALGVFAVTVTMPVLIAVLATAGGILVVSAGGGLIKPMQKPVGAVPHRCRGRDSEYADQ
ncbi:hypothetical protein [Hoyosella subflava]|uniref:hypothetical protein n=1 Tax=Hoyosella subflava TaxID=639313 RepID=UPI00178C3981|nr:hypothetical protein [Hoyosella subflava]